MNRITLAAAAVSVGFTLACAGAQPLAEPRDVSGNYELVYADNLRIYVNDELLAEVTAGSGESIEYNGETFDLEAVCGDAGTVCPSEAYWRTMAVDQPWGTEYRLINFINLDGERGALGERMGGTQDDAGRFEMLAGLDLDGNEACASIGVGTVRGAFTPENDITDGVIAFEWAAGCQFGEVVLTGSVRLETDVEGMRTGPLDLSGLQPEPPIDEEGEEVDPEAPEK